MILHADIPRGAGAARVAIVTGASRGLGLVVARLLAAEGFALVVDARGAGALHEAAAGLRAAGATVEALPGDVRDTTHRAALVRAARGLGGLDLLVNNASDLGPTPLPPLSGLDLGAFEDVLRANVVAPLALVQEALPLLKERRGLVVNVTSDAARGGYPGWGAYGAGKAALELVSLTLANELRADGVAAVVVDPGDLRTKMHQDAFPGEDISDRPIPQVTVPFWAWLLGRTPAEVSGGRFRAQAEAWEVPA
ncbi:MAG TPA: SDR family NAD(P)-dependent oxidoreductase [Candidatus Thermoplasmatota archaeon]